MMPDIISAGEPAGPAEKQKTDALTRAVGKLCSGCGLCCDGVLFTSVRLQNHERVDALKVIGIILEPQEDGWMFAQPCPAFQKGCCSIYAQRPGRCREFHCHLLQQLAHGQTTPEEAQKEIRDTRLLADRVTDLLGQLGDTDTTTPLSQRCRRRMQGAPSESEENLERRADLMLAVDALVRRLRDRFYADL